MSLQEVLDEERLTSRAQTVRAFYTVSGAEGAQIINATTNHSVSIKISTQAVTAALERLMSATVTWGQQQTGVVPAAVSSVEEVQYDPDFVAQILQADAAPPEAKFTNVVDMLEWLDRD
jgi:hypothetical protein